MSHRILIVEDEVRLREILCDYFRSKGENPVEACDGLQALSLIEEEEFDAVLLDIMMPGMDGLSLCRAVRRNNDIPIILVIIRNITYQSKSAHITAAVFRRMRKLN